MHKMTTLVHDCTFFFFLYEFNGILETLAWVLILYRIKMRYYFSQLLLSEVVSINLSPRCWLKHVQLLNFWAALLFTGNWRKWNYVHVYKMFGTRLKQHYLVSNCVVFWIRLLCWHLGTVWHWRLFHKLVSCFNLFLVIRVVINDLSICINRFVCEHKQ